MFRERENRHCRDVSRTHRPGTKRAHRGRETQRMHACRPRSRHHNGLRVLQEHPQASRRHTTRWQQHHQGHRIAPDGGERGRRDEAQVRIRIHRRQRNRGGQDHRHRQGAQRRHPNLRRHR